MTPWDSDKSTAADPDNPAADEQLTADEWDKHVSEGHFPADELNFGVDGNGDPVITDPQNSDEVIATYDRSAGEWVIGGLTVNGAVSTDQADINDYSATLEKTTDQSITSGTDVTVDWDNQTLDTNIYTFNTGLDTLDVLEDGDYRVNAHARLTGGSDQDLMQIKVFVNGNLKKIWEVKSSGTQGSPSGSSLLKGLSANDKIRIDVRDNNSGATLDGIASLAYADVTKEA